MSIEIDTENATCTLSLNGESRQVPLDRLRVITDPQRRASSLEGDGDPLPITEPDAERLVAAGVADGRANLIADD